MVMEYQKVINLLDSTPNQPTKCRIKNFFELNDGARGTYNTNSQIKFKTSMLRSILCDYSDAVTLVSGTIKITGGGAQNDQAKRLDEGNKGVIFENCAPFTHCISEINNTQIDNAKYIDVVMPMYNLIEYGDNYSKISEIFWQYCKDDPNDNITESKLFKFKIKKTEKTLGADNKKMLR